jgi:arylformamidase
MFATINHKGRTLKADLHKGFDISIAVAPEGVRAWYAEPPVIEPVRMGNWVGEVKQGGSVNFKNVFFNPHAHGTHTESVGHITPEGESVNGLINRAFYVAELVTVLPEQTDNGDFVITRRQLHTLLEGKTPEAVIIRTIANPPVKRTTNWSNTNPPYLAADAALLLAEMDVEHLLIDLPSVDREVDGGALSAHKTFWNYPENTRRHCTITELVYVPNDVFDGAYLLNLQTAAIENDAVPSRPVLYRIVS